VCARARALQLGAVLRAEDGSIRIGARTNVQDNTVMHCEAGANVTVGDDVTIGHTSIIHGCSVGNRCIVGMGSILMNKCNIGEGCMVGVRCPIATHHSTSIGLSSSYLAQFACTRLCARAVQCLHAHFLATTRVRVQAGTLVTEGASIAPGSVVMGRPGKAVKAVPEGMASVLQLSADAYVHESALYRDSGIAAKL
jgi:carbonic anhydrase/acetyltransferase-like protein (isoleucine patch superfamily)